MQRSGYYPDLMIGCDPNDSESYFLPTPQVIVEVLSESTEAIDRRLSDARNGSLLRHCLH